MNFKYQHFKFVWRQVRLISNSGKSKNHYNSLGISSTSTQGEVKAAYYKLSMMHHPDKTQNNPESSQKFRDITEAYEVLGNVKTRKLYDKGLYFGTDTYTDHTTDKFYKSRETRSRPPPPTGRTPIYDFDEWSRNHYGATFQRSMRNKRRHQFNKYRQEQEADDIKMEKALFVLGLILVICMLMFQSEKNSYDTVTYFGGISKIKKDEKD